MFCSEAAKISSADKQLTNIIGNALGPEAISQLFHEKHKTLYNSVPTSDSDLSNIKNTMVERLHPSEVSNLDRVTPELICHCIGKLKPGQGDGCLLDAPKVFDRVHYGKLFNILLSKKLPICIIRMLLDYYIRQESRPSWSSYYTDYYTMSNRVKQGGVLSAILFLLYLDKLLIRL